MPYNSLSLYTLMQILLCAAFMVLLTGCGFEQADFADSMPQKKSLPGDILFADEFAQMDKLQEECSVLWPLQEKLSAPRVSEWQYHVKEKEQSPHDYIRKQPITITPDRQKLYLCKAGSFTSEQERILPIIAEFLGIYFQCSVKWLPPLEIIRFPSAGLDIDKLSGNTIIRSIYLTDNILKPGLPSDGWGVLAITGNEIHKNGNRGEQYGDALLYGRAGVISLFYFSDKQRNRMLLERSLKGASHEVCHLLSIPHCTRFSCNMNGRMGMEQFDRCPLYLCPQCLEKLLYSTHANLQKRANALAVFTHKHQLAAARYYEKAVQAVQRHPTK